MNREEQKQFEFESLELLFPLGKVFSKRDVNKVDWVLTYMVDSFVKQGKIESLGKGLFKIADTKPVYHYEV